MTSANQFFKVHNNLRAQTVSTAKLQLDSDWKTYTRIDKNDVKTIDLRGNTFYKLK